MISFWPIEVLAFFESVRHVKKEQVFNSKTTHTRACVHSGGPYPIPPFPLLLKTCDICSHGMLDRAPHCSSIQTIALAMADCLRGQEA